MPDASKIIIRACTYQDCAALSDMYNFYIQETSHTFAEKLVQVEYFERLLQQSESLQVPFLVLEKSGIVVGYSYATPWRERCAYRYSLECAVYLQHEVTGQGLGRMLYEYFIEQIRNRGYYHLLIAGITLPNVPSIALHESLGFKKVAHFQQVGYKFNQWLDVGYWQLTL